MFDSSIDPITGIFKGAIRRCPLFKPSTFSQAQFDMQRIRKKIFCPKSMAEWQQSANTKHSQTSLKGTGRLKRLMYGYLSGYILLFNHDCNQWTTKQADAPDAAVIRQ